MFKKLLKKVLKKVLPPSIIQLLKKMVKPFEEGNPLNEHKVIVSCPHCNAAEYQYIYSDLKIAKCKACDLIYARVRYGDEYWADHYSNAYLEGAEEVQYDNVFAPKDAVSALLTENDFSWFEQQARDAIPHFIEAFNTTPEALQNKKFLEVGTGWGRILLTAKQLGMEPVGYEICLPNCKLGNDLGLDIRHEDFSKAVVASNCFEYIYLFHSLEHFVNPTEYLKAIYESCAPEGYIYISVPNFDCFWHEMLETEWPWLSPDGHLTQFTTETLKMVVQDAGFTVLSCTTEMDTNPTGCNYDVAAKHLKKSGPDIVDFLTELNGESKGESIVLLGRK